MRFDVSPPGPLSGETPLPGDSELTLSALALGSLSGAKVTIDGPSRSSMWRSSPLPLRLGKRTHGRGGMITVRGGMPDGEVLSHAPARPSARLMSAAAVFSGRTARFEDRGPDSAR